MPNPMAEKWGVCLLGKLGFVGDRVSFVAGTYSSYGNSLSLRSRLFKPFANPAVRVAIIDCSPLWLKTCHWHVFLTRRASGGSLWPAFLQQYGTSSREARCSGSVARPFRRAAHQQTKEKSRNGTPPRGPCGEYNFT